MAYSTIYQLNERLATAANEFGMLHGGMTERDCFLTGFLAGVNNMTDWFHGYLMGTGMSENKAAEIITLAKNRYLYERSGYCDAKLRLKK